MKKLLRVLTVSILAFGWLLIAPTEANPNDPISVAAQEIQDLKDSVDDLGYKDQFNNLIDIAENKYDSAVDAKQDRDDAFAAHTSAVSAEATALEEKDLAQSAVDGQTVTVATALDNKNDVVWIRLRAPLSTSNITLSQIYNALGITNTNPTMSGIDDWNLSWTDNTPPPPDPTSVSNLNTLANTYTSRMIGNSIQVKFNKGYASPTIIRLTDMNGAIIWQKQYPTIKAEQVEWISSGLLSKGIYLLQIQNREGQGTQRIAK